MASFSARGVLGQARLQSAVSHGRVLLCLPSAKHTAAKASQGWQLQMGVSDMHTQPRDAGRVGQHGSGQAALCAEQPLPTVPALAPQWDAGGHFWVPD